MTGSGEPVTVVVADDQSAVREGLVLLLGTLPGIAVTGEAADGDAAVQVVAAVRPRAAPLPEDAGRLTPRESEVLRLIAAGESNRAIARNLFVSDATVKTHVNRIFAKTGSRDRAQATRYAYAHGYADPPAPAAQRARPHP
jgi:DNA-binding NarL/FixJ family response regulator